MGWFLTIPENIPELPDPDNAGEGNDITKGIWFTPNPFFMPIRGSVRNHSFRFAGKTNTASFHKTIIIKP